MAYKPDTVAFEAQPWSVCSDLNLDGCWTHQSESNPLLPSSLYVPFDLDWDDAVVIWFWHHPPMKREYEAMRLLSIDFWLS